MSEIVAGTFEQGEQADAATRRLIAAGVPGDRVCTFFVNPPGQHARFPIGGDTDKSPGAKEAHTGATTGAAVGTAVGVGVGLAATPFLGPAGVVAGLAAGAYAGALAGGVDHMGAQQDGKNADTDAAAERETPVRAGGMLVAVTPVDPAMRDTAVRILNEGGARDGLRSDAPSTADLRRRDTLIARQAWPAGCNPSRLRSRHLNARNARASTPATRSW